MKNGWYQFDTAIKFIDIHRFHSSMDKNHLSATEFYRLTTPGIQSHIQLNLEKISTSGVIHFFLDRKKAHKQPKVTL